MSIVNQKKWTITAVIGLAYWLFGNLYEEIVFSPNWIMNSQVQLKRLNEFFVNTSPTIYFVPVTQIATLLVWILSWSNKENSVKKDYQKASIFALIATIFNIIIVSNIAMKMFGSDFQKYGEYLTTLCW
jgi:hypothetical protein